MCIPPDSQLRFGDGGVPKGHYADFVHRGTLLLSNKTTAKVRAQANQTRRKPNQVFLQPFLCSEEATTKDLSVKLILLQSVKFQFEQYHHRHKNAYPWAHVKDSLRNVCSELRPRSWNHLSFWVIFASQRDGIQSGIIAEINSIPASNISAWTTAAPTANTLVEVHRSVSCRNGSRKRRTSSLSHLWVILASTCIPVYTWDRC